MIRFSLVTLRTSVGTLSWFAKQNRKGGGDQCRIRLPKLLGCEASADQLPSLTPVFAVGFIFLGSVRRSYQILKRNPTRKRRPKVS